MKRQIFNTYSPKEVNSMLELIDMAISMMVPCEEDKELSKCLICNKRQSIVAIKTIKSILEGKNTYLNENDL